MSALFFLCNTVEDLVSARQKEALARCLHSVVKYQFLNQMGHHPPASLKFRFQLFLDVALFDVEADPTHVEEFTPIQINAGPSSFTYMANKLSGEAHTHWKGKGIPDKHYTTTEVRISHLTN